MQVSKVCVSLKCNNNVVIINLFVMVQVLFPSLYNLFGANSLNYSDVLVKKSSVNDNCVIIYAHKPIEWLFNHMENKDLPAYHFDNIELKINSDNSLSIFNK